MSKQPCKLLVCTEGKRCRKRGGKQILRKLREVVKKQGLELAVTVKATDCMKLCKFGPSIMAMPDKVAYGHVTEDDCHAIAAAAAKGDQVDALVVERKSKRKSKK